MKRLIHTFIVGALLAIFVGSSAPMYANPVLSQATLEGAVGQNLDTTSQAGTSLFDTGVQTGSPVSTILPPWTFTCSTCTGYTITASGDAKVVNGSLGAESSVTVTGTVGPHFSAAADDTADYFDTLTITGGTGTGVLVLQYTLDGSTTETGTGPNPSFLSLTNLFATDFQVGSGTVTSGTEADFFGLNATSTTVTFYLPFTYGSALATELTLDAFADFAPSAGTTTVDFFNTASLDSALVFAGTPTSLGAQNTSANINSASGISFGAAAVPEPGSWLLVGSAMAVLGLLRRRVPRQSEQKDSTDPGAI